MKYEFFVTGKQGVRLEVRQDIPDKGDKFQTIIMVPGFGVDLHEYGLFDDLSTDLVKNGFATWRFSFSGTGTSAGDFQHTTVQSQIVELQLIIEAVMKDRFTQTSQVGILAHAFGASVTIAASPSEAIRSLLLISPMAKPFVTISKMYKRQWNFRPDEVSKVERPNKEITTIGPQFWKSTQNTRLVAKSRQITQPTLIIHAQKDYKVKNTDISEYFRALTVPKKVHIIEKADHGFSGKFRPKVMELTTEWFEETLRAD